MVASLLAAAAVVPACSADVDDMDACHYLVTRACEAAARCAPVPSTCEADLQTRCVALDIGADTDTLKACADAIEDAPCGTDGVYLPTSCTDERDLDYLWAEPGVRGGDAAATDASDASSGDVASDGAASDRAAGDAPDGG